MKQLSIFFFVHHRKALAGGDQTELEQKNVVEKKGKDFMLELKNV
jgi:hypothetical protein